MRESVNFLSSNIVVLFDTPLSQEMAIKEVMPADSRLFFNQFAVPFRKSSWVKEIASKPAVKSGDKEIKKVMIGGVGIVGLA
jgi:hypothetical protein